MSNETNKPSWNDAPEWAGYLAMDANGRWYWFENEPEAEAVAWDSIGRFLFSGQQADTGWHNTLERRPGR